MRVVKILYPLVLTAYTASAFNKSIAAVQEALAVYQKIPQCAQGCSRAVIATSKCSLLDIECSCTDPYVASQGAACLRAACTVREQLSAANLTDQICQRPVRNRSADINRAAISGLPIAIAAYAMRLTSKVHFLVTDSCGTKCIGSIYSELWWDDAVITLALCFIIPLTVLTVPGLFTENKIGYDIWYLTPKQIQIFMHILFHAEWMYVASLACIKISMLCSYLRFFFAPRFRELVYLGIALNIIYFLNFAFLSIFQCHPVKLSWERWETPELGMQQCLNFNVLGWTSAGINIVLDLYVILLPMPMIWSMSLNKRKKFLVMLMFGVGLFVTLISILRLHVMVTYGKSENVTWDYVSLAYWTLLELHFGLLCTSMPAIRNILRRFIPYLMGIDLTSGRRSGTELSGQTAVASRVTGGRRSLDDKGEFLPLEEVELTSRDADTDSIVLERMQQARTAALPPTKRPPP